MTLTLNKKRSEKVVILVDTCVLSEVFQKSSKLSKFSEQIAFFRQMILDDWPIAIPGIVFQESLTGFDRDKKRALLSKPLKDFPTFLRMKRIIFLRLVSAQSVVNHHQKLSIS